MNIEICIIVNITHLYVTAQNMFWLDSTYIWKLGTWSSLHLFSKIILHGFDAFY